MLIIGHTAGWKLYGPRNKLLAERTGRCEIRDRSTVVRVETDWYPHESEFRYVLQPGESIAASHGIPIGQVFFMPRDPITLRDATEAETTERRERNAAFFKDKSAVKRRTPYGFEYSPHYQRSSRERRGDAD